MMLRVGGGGREIGVGAAVFGAAALGWSRNPLLCPCEEEVQWVGGGHKDCSKDTGRETYGLNCLSKFIYFSPNPL